MGSHLCDKLVADNNVICIDNFISGRRENIEHLLPQENFIFINDDINNLVDLEKYKELERFKIEFQGIQEIYNLACPTSPKNFSKNVVASAKTNSLGTMRGLDLAVKYKAKFLHFSSSVVYGPRDNKRPVVDETSYHASSPLTPRACYDEGKRFAETLVYTYRQYYGVDAKILRFFTTYGPRMPLFIGHMIPDFIVAALDNQPLLIYGDDKFTMTLCYISDAIDAALKMMASSEAGPFNIGASEEYKVSEVAKKIIKMTNSKSEIQYSDPLLFMSRLSIPNISMAKEKLEWFPVIILDKGLEETIEYARAHKVLIDWNRVEKVED